MAKLIQSLLIIVALGSSAFLFIITVRMIVAANKYEGVILIIGSSIITFNILCIVMILAHWGQQ